MEIDAKRYFKLSLPGRKQDGRKRIALASDCRECVCAGD